MIIRTNHVPNADRHLKQILIFCKLFEEEKDCIELIKIKEIMHELEKTTDVAEQVGKILKNLIIKYA